MRTFSLTRTPLHKSYLKNPWLLPYFKSIRNSILLFLLTFFSFSSFSQGIAPVLTPTGGFHIDGNLVANSPAANVGDWVAGAGGTGGFVINNDGSVLNSATTFNIFDPYDDKTNDVIFTEGSKGYMSPAEWSWVEGSPPNKNEINRALLHIAQAANGDVWLMMGGDRSDVEGTAYIDFELLQNTVTRAPGGGFTTAGPHGGRTINDLLITIEYNNGGGVSSIIYFRWLPDGNNKYSYHEITPGPLGFAVTNNLDGVSVPFLAFGNPTYDGLQFVEAGVNVSQVINFQNEDPCIGFNVKTVFIKTKASSSLSAALKDLVEPIQVGFNINEATLDAVGPLCASGGAVSLLGSPAGGTYSGVGVSGNSFDPSIAGPGDHVVTYTKQFSELCSKQAQITIHVDASSVAGTVNGAATVCSGSNGGSVSVTGKTGNVVRWEIMSQGGNWTTIPNAAGLSSINYSNLTTTTSYRVVVKSGVCPEATSAPATITVTAPSVAGVVAGAATVCSGSNGGSVSVSDKTGDVVRWEMMPQGGSWSTVPNSAGLISINYSNLTATTSYRVVVKNGVCPEATSAPAVITVNAASVAGTVGDAATVCTGSNGGSISVTGKVGDVVRWEMMPQGGSWSTVTNSAGLTSINYSNLTITTSYRVVVKSGVCPEATSAPVTITVNAGSVAGTVGNAATVCSGSNGGSVSVTGKVGDVVRWEMMPQGGSWSTVPGSAGLTSINYSNLTITTSYRVVVKSGTCPEVTSAPVTITITTPTVAGTVSGAASVCSGSNSGSVSVSGQVGSIVKWQRMPQGGSWTDIAGSAGLTSISYSNLAVTTSYRVVVKNGVCPEATSAPVTITVTPPAVGGSVTGRTLQCDNNTGGTLTLTGYSGTIVRWEKSSNNGATWIPIANTTNTLTYGLLTQKTIFRAVVQQGDCPIVYSNPLTVVVISCGPVGNHCTYTQGFYGNVGGLGCSGGLETGNVMEAALPKMIKAFDYIGQTKFVFGRADIGGVSTDDRAFTLFKEDVTNMNIFKMLPGGGTAGALGSKPGGTTYGDTYEGSTYSVASTWDGVPISPNGSTKGKIRNVLLAQTITLFFNMNNGTNLSAFALHDTLYVQNFDCLSGNAIETAPVLQFGIPHNVITYLTYNGGTYSKDVAGLFKLANDILGGVTISGITAADVNKAVDQINNAFDGCRSMVGFYDIPIPPTQVNGRTMPVTYNSMIDSKSTLKVAAYPNPYRDRVKFTVRSAVAGNATLDVYNMLGQKVANLYKGYVFADKYLYIDYEVLPSNRENLIYIFKVGNQQISGKLINPQ
ncbi:hypothetical protein ACQ33O_05205 [Ferruginibacter sp. SUN002]|uniref:hypothetical protein n=1 Tax=Ferruginibacter sp. SUN002 TaxID=2937789 RepID=UPI003D35F433